MEKFDCPYLRFLFFFIFCVASLNVNKGFQILISKISLVSIAEVVNTGEGKLFELRAAIVLKFCNGGGLFLEQMDGKFVRL